MSAEGIAIIGLAVRFPGADSVEAFWRNLRGGVESTTFFSEAELRAAGVDPVQLADPRYVRANGVLPGADAFDAEFFGLSPREAEVTDPQHRVLLELAWTALERAGYDPERMPGRAGVFAGAGLSTYLLKNLAPNRALVESVGELALLLGNNKDFAPTRISYKLNLRGPSVAVNTACSTSLVAVHLACQSLLDFHCDVALAGGVSVQVPQAQGYVHQAGGIGSPDGRTRTFDARAEGTVGGNGAGLVVLKRLADAIADGDTIHAVIRGSAVNNDGSAKVGFTAPSVEGQAQVIAEAQAVAGVAPRDISYVEAHGTGTAMGDPIELAALTEVFAASTADRGFCALGSVKTNFGHLDEAAGVAGLVKAVLALEHGELPPSLHYETPNPRIDFAGGPFYVNARLAPWPRTPGQPRRAGVSSFGIGGTNAHVVLEEAPAPGAAADPGTPQLLVLSARTPEALVLVAENLARDLEAHPQRSLADVAYTLALGRRAFAHRRGVVAKTTAEAAAALRGAAPAEGPAGLVATARDWEAGGAVDWVGFYAGQRRRRLPLPTYPFERRRHWIEAPSAVDGADSAPARKRARVEEWFYQSSWRQAAVPPAAATAPRHLVWFGPAAAGDEAIRSLRTAGVKVTVVDDPAVLDAAPAALAWARKLKDAGERPTDIVHARGAGVFDRDEGFAAAQADGYLSGLALVQALVAADLAAEVRLTFLLRHAADVTGSEVLAPGRATLLGLAKVIPQEFPGLSCRVVDLTGSEAGGAAVAAELVSGATDALVAYRGSRRWVHAFAPLALDSAAGAARLRPGAVTLITGGLGGVALIVAEHLARTAQARLVLVARRGLLAGASPVPRSELLELTAAEAVLARRRDLGEAATYRAFSGEVDRLCAVLAYHYLADAAPDRSPGRRQSVAALRADLGLLPAFGKFLDYFLHVLASDGYLDRAGDELTWRREPATVPSAASAIADLLARHPEFRGIVSLLAHCARSYPAALSGRVPAISVLYPDGRSDLLEAAGREMARPTNKPVRIALLRELVERLLAGAQGRKIRILEVGVGDGLLAGELVPGLAGRNAEYVATDLSRAFVVKAERAATAAGWDFVSFDVLDISRDPLAQGFRAESFDLIVAMDVIHATPRLAETLGHLRTLLTPEGALALVEKVRDERWVDLVWGLAEGWWCFADPEWRQLHPLLAAGDWERLLAGSAIGEVAVFPEEPAARAATDYALVTARRRSGAAAAVRRLEALGAEVVVEEADVADPAQLRAVVARTEARFGALHGVVHTAGLTTGAAVFNLLPTATAAQAEALFRPKARGAAVLAEVLGDRPLDFCVLISSNASVLGGLGLAAYAAANAYLDLLAAEQRRRGRGRWTSTNWDGWPTEPPPGAAAVRTSIDQFAMTRAEAEAAFTRVLAAPVAQVVVSSGDLAARQRPWARPAPRAPDVAGEAAAAEAASSFHARPAAAGPYVPPRSGAERAVAALWSELLGIDPVGAEDNFFDLEGDSLLGTQLVARLSQDFGVTLSVGVLFEFPSVAGLAARLEAAQAEAGEQEEGTL